MESDNSVVALHHQEDFLEYIDVRDAYLHVPIFLLHQKFLYFAIEHQHFHFQYLALPFGAGPGTSLLRVHNVCILVYLDELLISAWSTLAKCIPHDSYDGESRFEFQSGKVRVGASTEPGVSRPDPGHGPGKGVFSSWKWPFSEISGGKF